MNVSFEHLGLVGRLGNALYELAGTAGIAHTMGVEPRFNANWIHRPYFSVPDRYFTDDFTGCVQADRTHLAQHLDERARVYLQDYSLFADILPTLRLWLQPSALAVDELEARMPGVASFDLSHVLSVHVRRGDNAPGGDPLTPNKHLYHPMPTLDYYRAAITKLAHSASATMVFSDDIEWCERYLPSSMLPGQAYYHHGVVRPKEHEADYLTAPVLDWIDWVIQSRCGKHVCSNSTFGILAAIIAGDDAAVVPWPIFGPRISYVDATLLFPATWTRLDAGLNKEA